LADDLGEDRDVAADHPNLVADLAEKMAEAYRPSDRWKFPTGDGKKKRD
jgi:hypothetical protein